MVIFGVCTRANLCEQSVDILWHCVSTALLTAIVKHFNQLSVRKNIAVKIQREMEEMGKV